MKLILIALILIIANKVSGQRLPMSTYVNINFKSSLYIRVLDGVELNNDELPKNIIIDKVTTIRGDTDKLKKLGIVNFDKPYMILSSDVTNVRQFIYNKVRPNINLQITNLPIILNNEFISFDKYAKLGKIDTNQIVKIKYIKTIPKSIEKKRILPFGAILITEK